MAILMIVVSPDLKKEQYEQLRKEVDWEHNPPEGMIFHAASFDASGGIHVSDVWTNKEAVDRFFEARLLPGMRKLHIPAPTQKEIYPLQAAVALPGIEQYRARQASR